MSSPDLRPVLQESIQFGETLVTPTNPHGFNDSGGRDITRRFDKPECIPAYTELLDGCVAAGVQGILHWQPSGYLPGVPQYQIDSHRITPDVLPQFIAINKLAHDRGLWVGSLLRPAELAVRQTWDTESGMTFQEFTGDVAALLITRIAQLKSYGAGDAFYLDSFGFGELDAEIAAWLRQTVGPDVKLFTEAWSDRLGKYTGAYVQTPDGTNWLTYGQQFPVLRWLFPDQPCIAVDSTWRPWAERLAWGKANGVAPMVLNFEVPLPQQSASVELARLFARAQAVRAYTECKQVADVLRRHLTRHQTRYPLAALKGQLL